MRSGSARTVMDLSPGTRLGRYEVLSPLGQGGMREFYRAGDTWLPNPLLDLPERGERARCSPDGRWSAYTSSEVGSSLEVMVRAFPPTEMKVHVGMPTKASAVSNHVVGWSASGAELFYTENHARFLAPDVTLQPTLRVGNITPLPISPSEEEFEITPDGAQFLIASREETRPSHMNVVVNWFEELRRPVPRR